MLQEKLNYLQMDKSAMDAVARERESQVEPKHVNTSVAEMLARMEAIQKDCEGDDKKQLEELNKYYEEVV